MIVVLSGRSESNSLFDNRATGNLMGVRKADKRLMRFEEFVSDLMRTESRDRVLEIVQETRASYVSNMMTFLPEKDLSAKIIFWFSERTPEYQERFGNTWERESDGKRNEGFAGSFLYKGLPIGRPFLQWRLRMKQTHTDSHRGSRPSTRFVDRICADQFSWSQRLCAGPAGPHGD